MFLVDTHVVFCKSVTMLVVFIVKQQFYCRTIIFTTSRLLEKSGNFMWSGKWSPWDTLEHEMILLPSTLLSVQLRAARTCLLVVQAKCVHYRSQSVVGYIVVVSLRVVSKPCLSVCLSVCFSEPVQQLSMS